jgi:excinuclease UvrABC nuclease subunit
MPAAGIYVFSEGDQALYVGRSNDLRGRIGRQCRPGATHRIAAFAFRLARDNYSELARRCGDGGTKSRLLAMSVRDFQ